MLSQGSLQLWVYSKSGTGPWSSECLVLRKSDFGVTSNSFLCDEEKRVEQPIESSAVCMLVAYQFDMTYFIFQHVKSLIRKCNKIHKIK